MFDRIAHPALPRALFQFFLYLTPPLGCYDRLLLATVDLLAVPDIARIDWVRKDMMNVAAIEQAAARLLPSSCFSLARTQLQPFSCLFYPTDRPMLFVKIEERSDDLASVSLIASVLPFGSYPKDTLPPHPQALAFRGSNLVSNPFRRHFAFELRKREQHVQCQASHAGGCVERLGH